MVVSLTGETKKLSQISDQFYHHHHGRVPSTLGAPLRLLWFNSEASIVFRRPGTKMPISGKKRADLALAAVRCLSKAFGPESVSAARKAALVL